MGLGTKTIWLWLRKDYILAYNVWPTFGGKQVVAGKQGQVREKHQDLGRETLGCATKITYFQSHKCHWETLQCAAKTPRFSAVNTGGNALTGC